MREILGGGLAQLNNATGIYVAYSTALGKVAKDGKGKNGLFTKHLIKYINEEGLTIEKVFKKVRKKVKRDSNGKQIPWSSSSIDGDFYFTLPKGDKKVVKQNSTITPLGEVITKFTPIFKTTPRGATVEIEGYGTWQSGMRLKKGTYTIKVSKSGYITQRFRIELKNSGSFALTINRESKQQNVKKIVVKDSNGIVVINGVSYQNDRVFDKEYSWKEAKKQCRDLKLGGYSDWRLPTREELKKILTKNKIQNSKGHYHYIKKEFVENLSKYSWFWTSEEKNDSSAWVVFFNNGSDSWNNKSNKNYVRCVRVGQ